ncbi:amino acid permease [Micromonospora sp. NPDC047620]|uniref:amino acid permease n=1 Tax=Micromonospora sp. NPDC047620 TaxID=3364251 RepID=UPI0037143E61
MLQGLMRTKSVEQSIAEADEPKYRMKRSLSALDLTVFGVGIIIGTGIFVLTGQQAARNAGPAIILSFLIAGVVCALVAVCYAELATTLPVAGAAYTFSYATLGELVAWIIGWDLTLELAIVTSVVARGWSAYLHDLFNLPDTVAGDAARPDWGAIFIVVLLGIMALFGTKLSGRVSAVLVAVKVAVVLFVIALGAFFIKAANYTPFIPPSQPAEKQAGSDAPLLQVLLGVTPQHFGVFGILAAASIVFFAYIGFDVVANTAEETRNPQRDMPRGILASLAICAVLYMAVSFVITGMAHYTRLDTGAPLARAFDEAGIIWAAKIIDVGALSGITTVILVLLVGQTRVLFAMSRDGLLPRGLGAVHPRLGTPWIITLVMAVAVSALAGSVPLSQLTKLVNIGTLFAFVMVCLGVIVLRRTRPDLHRTFRAPGVPWLPALAILACLWLMLNLPVKAWMRFLVWMALGLVVYFAYGRHHSRLGRRLRR